MSSMFDENKYGAERVAEIEAAADKLVDLLVSSLKENSEQYDRTGNVVAQVFAALARRGDGLTLGDVVRGSVNAVYYAANSEDRLGAMVKVSEAVVNLTARHIRMMGAN